VTASPGADGAPPNGTAERRRAGAGSRPDGAPGDGRPERRTGRRIRGLEPEERRQERRRQLLESGCDLFATQGYAHTSIEQICQGAFVGFKGFYDEFATKEALFLTLYADLVERVSASVVAVLEVGVNPESAVRDMVTAFVRVVLDDRRVAQVLFIEAAGLSPAVEAERRLTFRGFADFLQSIFSASAPLRDLQAPPGRRARRISLGLVGGVVEILVDWLVDPDPDDIEDLIDDLESYCQVVLRGIEINWPHRSTPPEPG
jgi:AcrR family transcriptional regulator